MSKTMQLAMGSDVACSDGVCGNLQRVVVDSVDHTLTHLVVEPKHRPGAGHLVPIDAVDSTTDGIIHLSCTTSEFEALEDADETQLLPGASEEWDYGQASTFSLPYYGLGTGGMSEGPLGMGGMGRGAGPKATTYDRVPSVEVEVRRGEHVHATNGTIGRVRGLIIDSHGYQVTHILLGEGHLWGKKRIAIPISAVMDIEEGVRLTLSKDEVRDLPSFEVDQDVAPS